jgi:DNA-binding transcriptional LysR family regulator
MNLLTSMRYLVALNEHRHFARAAQACHITQPALSNALKALEEEFGAVIVRRGRSFAGFSPEGEQVLATALAMLRAEEGLRQELSAAAGALRGQLRMAAVPTAMPMLTRFAAMLRQRHPGIMPVVLSMSSAEIESGLEDLSLDLALGYSARMPPRGPRLQSWPQYQEHYYLLCRDTQCDSRPFAFGADIAWSEVAGMPLCLLTPDMQNRRIINQHIAEAGSEARATLESNSMIALFAHIRTGKWSSIMPLNLIKTLGLSEPVRAIPINEPDVGHKVGLVVQHREPHTPIVSALMHFARGISALHAGD